MRLIKANWENFKAKFSENPQDNFEWFCYLLFLKEYNQPYGTHRYKNQSGIETDPIKVGDEVIGWQSKFYEDTLSNHKEDLLGTLRKTKRDNPNITKIILYTNSEWGQGQGTKEPKAKTETEEKAKELNIELIWRVQSYFESPFVCQEQKDISSYFFEQDIKWELTNLGFKDKISDNYQTNFKTISLLLNDKKPIDDIFINLAIIKEQKEKKKKEKEEAYKREAILNSYEEIHKPKEPIEIKELLNTSKKSLIYGKAGVGKTTLCKYIAYKWANNELYEAFDYVVYIALREWKRDGLKGAILNNYYSSDIKELYFDMEENNSKTLFLFDGYDELDANKKATLQKEINTYNLQNYIITTRPYGYQKSDFNVDESFETIGFTDENIEQYIEAFFKENSEKSKGLKEFLQSNISIKYIAYIPLMLEMICSLWKEGKLENITTMSELYSQVVENILKKHSALKNDERVYKRENRKKIYEQLGTLAFEGLTQQKIVFDGDFIEETIDDIEFFEQNTINSGFLKSDNIDKDLLDNNFEFLHLTFQEYLTAYFINDKEFDSKKIKEIFSHNLRFYEKFEEVIIYLTNMQPKLFDDFVEFDPFIFRRHPLLTKEQQEKLLKSIINKLQYNESFSWDRVNFFYNTSLVKFNDINVYSLIKDKNLENSKSDILLQYIMRLFSENYSKEFEEYIFKIFSKKKNDKLYCSKLITYSYNDEYTYNQKVFEFMRENELFLVEDKTDKFSINRNVNSTVINSLFFQLAKEKYDISKTLKLLKYIENEDFIRQLNLVSHEESSTIDDLKEWFDYLYDFKVDKYNRNFKDNIKYIVYLLIIHYPNLDTILDKLIFYCDKYKISYQYHKNDIFRESYITILPTFYSISDDFFNIYFSDKIHNFSDVENFLSIYHIRKIDIKKMQKKYPFEDNFIKTFKFLEYVNHRKENEEENFLALEQEELRNIVDRLENFKYDEELIDIIFRLFIFNYSDRLEDLVFQILENYRKNIKVCRGYIEQTLITNYKYNLRLFHFMKENKLFRIENNKIEDWLFNGLYGLWFQNNKPKLEKNDYKQDDILILFEYISYYHFFDISEHIDIKDIEKWFNYFYENYNKELLKTSIEYKYSLGWIAYKLLTTNNLEQIPLEKIMILFSNTELDINFNPSERHSYVNPNNKNSPEPLFYTIKNEFWDIYFSDKIENFDKIKKIISLYHISKDDLKEAIKKYPIEENIEKYYSLAIQYTFIDTLIDSKEYQEHIEIRKHIENLDYSEKNYLDKIIQREEDEKYLTNIGKYKDEYIFDIFYYVISQKENFKDADTKLKKDLGNNYENFIKEVSKSYTSLEKKYYDDCSPNNDWIYNYLFNILVTKEELTKVLISDSDYKKLFWYIILGCISTDNQLLFEVMKDKFDLFINTVQEFIELIIKEENNNCLDSSLKRGHNIAHFPCRQIIDIFNKIQFDKKSDTWLGFIKYIKIIEKDIPQYNRFFELILEINSIPIATPLSHFYNLLEEDVNKALEYFYISIYNPISYKINYSTEKKGHSLILMNDVYNNYLTGLKHNLESNNIFSNSYSRNNRRTEKEKKEDREKALAQKVEKFYKDKKCSYNVIKIILFNKLLTSIQRQNSKEIDEIYIKKILIDYYKLFKEEKVPLAKDYYPVMSNTYFRNNNSITNNIIIKLWGLLQSDTKYEKLLKELKKSDNKFITDSAEYCLLKIYEEDRSFVKKDYKKIFDTYQVSKDNDKGDKVLIITEGKTDWKHLKKALERFQDDGEYLDLNIEFKEFDNISTSDTELANYAESLAKEVNVQKRICIFDRDLPNRLKDYGQNEFTHVANKQLINTIKNKCKNEYGERSKKYLDIEKELEVSNYKKIDKEIKSILTGKEYEEWEVILNNNVYAFCIPKISIHLRKLRKINFLNTQIKLTLRDFQHHYKEFGKNSIDKLNEVCIEFYYEEKDLKKEDSHGKRLFTADEFKFNKETNDCNQFISKCGKFKTDTQSGNNKKTKHITLQYPNKNERGYVYRNDDEECNKFTNMNLTKNEFAENIYNEVEGFNDFDIENFRLIFDVIEKIIND